MKILLMKKIPQVECSGLTVAYVEPPEFEFIKEFIEKTAKPKGIYCTLPEKTEITKAAEIAKNTLQLVGVEVSIDRYFKYKAVGGIYIRKEVKPDEAEFVKIFNNNEEEIASYEDNTIIIPAKGITLKDVMKISEHLYSKYENVYISLDYRGYGSSCSTYIEAKDGRIEISTMDWWPEHAKKLAKVVKKLSEKYDLLYAICGDCESD